MPRSEKETHAQTAEKGTRCLLSLYSNILVVRCLLGCHEHHRKAAMELRRHVAPARSVFLRIHSLRGFLSWCCVSPSITSVKVSLLVLRVCTTYLQPLVLLIPERQD